jgi:hypothetical protein
MIHDARQVEMFTPTPRVVGFWAPAPQSGKTTSARWLAEHSDWTMAAFADPVRRIALDLALAFGESYVDAYKAIIGGVDKEAPLRVTGKSAIDFLMLVGTKVGREFIGPNVWVDHMRERVVEAHERGAHAVIDDVRFPNERDLVRELGGVMVGVWRPGATVSESRKAAEGLLSMDDMDVVVVNDGSVDDLRRNVELALSTKGVRL